MLVSNYPNLRDSRLKWVSNSFLTAYISQWHPLLPKRGSVIVQADILCTNGTLYQGELLDYFLRDGELSGILLKNPRRFDRQGYLKAKAESVSGQSPETKDYWRRIPSMNLYFFAERILNLNLTYLTPSGQVQDVDAAQKFITKALPPSLGKLTVSLGKGASDSSGTSQGPASADSPKQNSN